MTTEPHPPAGYEGELGGYKAVMFDASCGKPIAWGFLLLGHLGEQRFQALSAVADLQCIEAGRWCVVARWLTPEEAEAEYGKVTQVERGPRGGFRSITYGTTRFLQRRLVPA